MRIAGAAVLVLLAAVLAAGAHDVLAWRATRCAVPRCRRAQTWLPGDPVRSALSLDDDIALRRAVRSFRIAFDHRARLRQRRDAHDAPVARRGAADGPGHARAARGCVAGREPARGARRRERSRDGWDHGRRSRALHLRGCDPPRPRQHRGPRYNLELLLRRTRATSTRQGPGNGSGAWATGAEGPVPAHRAGGTDVVASLTFLTPRGGLLGLVALIPLGRARGLDAPSGADRACTRAAAGEAPPGRGLRNPRGRRVRARRARGGSAGLAQHRAASRPDGVAGLLRRRCLALDGSRRQSLGAHAPGPGALRRHPAARRRADGAGGLAGLTDRVLPYLFPTLDEHAFQETLARSVHIESPPPSRSARTRRASRR